MTKTARRKRLGVQEWREVLRRFWGSGLGVQEFCEREGLGRGSFYQWRGRLSAPSPRAQRRRQASRPEATAGFVDLGALDAKEPRFELRVDLGAGVVLSLVRG